VGPSPKRPCQEVLALLDGQWDSLHALQYPHMGLLRGGHCFRAGSRNFSTGIGLAHTKKNTTLGAVNYWNDSDLSVMNRFLLVMNYNYCKCRTLAVGVKVVVAMLPAPFDFRKRTSRNEDLSKLSADVCKLQHQAVGLWKPGWDPTGGGNGGFKRKEETLVSDFLRLKCAKPVVDSWLPASGSWNLSEFLIFYFPLSYLHWTFDQLSHAWNCDDCAFSGFHDAKARNPFLPPTIMTSITGFAWSYAYVHLPGLLDDGSVESRCRLSKIPGLMAYLIANCSLSLMKQLGTTSAMKPNRSPNIECSHGIGCSYGMKCSHGTRCSRGLGCL